jgi:hypothetical protein
MDGTVIYVVVSPAMAAGEPVAMVGSVVSTPSGAVSGSVVALRDA